MKIHQLRLKNIGLTILFFAIRIIHCELKIKNNEGLLLNITLANVQRNLNIKYEAFEHHPCHRICQPGQTLTCYYKLVVHNYQRLGPECNRCRSDERECAVEHCIYGDGVPAAVIAVNGMLPGPPIEVCENDMLIVDVDNQLQDTTTMHWHGLHMSQTPEMDGVPFVTQYPLQPSEVYRYSFKADRSGTMWYHSHVGWQRSLGVAGSFVIRQVRKENPHARLYDYDLTEHTLLIGDIIYDNKFTNPANILINGKGRNHRTTLTDNDFTHRYERLQVTSGYRYRIRVISNGVFDCPIEFSVEQHRMLIISTDGNDIVPVLVDSFFITSGERFDFVLDANQHANNYWIRVSGYGSCSRNNLYQCAVLNYRGAAHSEPPSICMDGAVLGQGEKGKMVIANVLPEIKLKREKSNIATTTFQSLDPPFWSPNTKFLTYYSSFGGPGRGVFQIDDITFKSPEIPLLQSRQLYQDSEHFCNRSSLLAAGKDCVRNKCECTNVLQLPAYKPIELVVVNTMKMAHPFHLHGYTFRLVGQGVIGNKANLKMIEDIDRQGGLPRVPADFNAVQKDTVNIPALGFIIVRFMSDNPGFWLYHCHTEPHAVRGMIAVLKVGENNQMKSIP